MIDLKKETMKKNIYFVLSIISVFIFIAGIMCTIMGEDSPVKFIINESPIKLVVPPLLVFLVTFALYRKSKRVIENTK